MLVHPTYVVLEVPEPFARAVTLVRSRYSPRMVDLPVELTLTGSSGVGVFHPRTERSHVCAALERVAADFAPISVRFLELLEFPGTGIFYLRPTPAEPIVALHRNLLTLGFEFEESPFPFTPHVTAFRRARSSPEIAPVHIEDLVAGAAVSLASLALYSQTRARTDLLFRTKLRGEPRGSNQ